MATIFKKPGKTTWWITYYHAGSRVRRSLKTRDERIAKKKLVLLEAQLLRGDTAEPSRTPIAPLLVSFCEYLGTVRSRKAYKNDIGYLRGFFGPLCPALVPKRVTPSHTSIRPVAVRTLEEVTPALIDAFITRRLTQDGIAAKTANRLREVLHVMFTYAIRQEGFRSGDPRYPNPVAAVPRRREPAPQIRFLSSASIRTQLELLKDRPLFRAAVATLIYAGLRRDEVLWLTPADVDLDDRMIRVCRKTVADQSWQPKTSRNRRIPISSRLAGYLSEYDSKRNGLWFFPTKRGTRWDPDNFSGRLRKLNRAAGLDWSCLHFRHTFGSHLAMKGESLFKISELMGNSPEICRRHYAALVPEQMRDSVEFG